MEKTGPSSDGTCLICTAPLLQDLGMAPCGHTFHHSCIKAWTDSRPVCPICESVAVPLVPLFVKVQASEDAKEKLGTVLGSLELSRAEAEKAKAMESMKSARENYEAAKSRLEYMKSCKSEVTKETNELKTQIQADRDEKEEHDRTNHGLRQSLERIRALAASDEAIQKVLKACRRAKVGEDFMDISTQFSGSNRAYVLHKQLECLRKESLTNSNKLKQLSAQRRKEDRSAREEANRAKSELSALNETLMSMEAKTQTMRSRITRIQKTVNSREPLQDLTTRSTKRARRKALAS
uniref:RING-type domain-containing protein n=1 Tax=Lotharella oceanica TaxID=641309 RepID=A0A7S2TRC2_9EUKA|mmetsp:Transcript_26439/g.49409  ORF Transcript_26439/g.49409 Transcript_26439/m.49409 type:complete len:294 (+) Transcript_26439:46-927(+)